MKKMTWLAALALGLAFTAGGTQAQAADAASNSVIHTGVYIDGIDVSGLTAAEAREELEAYVEEMGAETLTLKIGDHQLQPALSELGLECTNLDVTEEAVQLGKVGNIIQRYKDRKDLEHENKNYQLEWTLIRLWSPNMWPMSAPSLIRRRWTRASKKMGTALPMCRGRQAFCWTQTEQRRLLSIILKMNGITRREAWSFRQPSTSPGAARRS